MFPDEPTSALAEEVTFSVAALRVVVPDPEIPPLILMVPELSVIWSACPEAADEAASATVAAVSIRITLALELELMLVALVVTVLLTPILELTPALMDKVGAVSVTAPPAETPPPVLKLMALDVSVDAPAAEIIPLTDIVPAALLPLLDASRTMVEPVDVRLPPPAIVIFPVDGAERLIEFALKLLLMLIASEPAVLVAVN